ncbi:hypothetical protein B296_00029691 [Ensete ventricosum]|uniref:Uncharacterized protein n=1 Tax=Ensete ventricosum TaxID=4639 RepID=A0A426ZWM5_ENSVE|nr:hypothetical protein B296_00029691 [Ensete ventricosum]
MGGRGVVCVLCFDAKLSGLDNTSCSSQFSVKEEGLWEPLVWTETCEIKQLCTALRLPPHTPGARHSILGLHRLAKGAAAPRISTVGRGPEGIVKSKEELGESSKGGSPFVLEIQDRPILTRFRLPSLESYDGDFDPAEHVTAFRAQMTLYDTSDALICRCFLTR